MGIMVAQRGTSSIMNKLGEAFRKAWNAHKDDDVEYSSFGELPPGINGGVAQLVECKIDLYKEGQNQGEPYFYAAGVVVMPVEHTYRYPSDAPAQTVRVEGLRTSIMEALCETPGKTRASVEEHLAWVINELKKLGLVTGDINPNDIEAHLQGLKTAQPYFRFRTWKADPERLEERNGEFFVFSGKRRKGGPYASEEEAKENHKYLDKDGLTNHSWSGWCEYAPPAGGGGVVDKLPKSPRNGERPQQEEPPSDEHEAGQREEEYEREQDQEVETPPQRPTPRQAPRQTSPPPRGVPGKPADKAPGTRPVPRQSPTQQASAPSTARTQRQAPTQPAQRPQTRRAPAPPPEPEPDLDNIDAGDLNSLAERAANKDEGASRTLEDMALSKGYTQADLDNARSWQEVVEMIEGPGPEGSQEAENEVPGSENLEAPQAPQPDDLCLYHLRDAKGALVVDPRTRKPAKPIEVMVVDVDMDSGTCTLKNMDTNEMIKDLRSKRALHVRWEDLEGN
jgi:hypothetical protein